MKVEQKTYAQVAIAARTDFIIGMIYDQYEAVCPFLCFPGILARDFRTSLRKPGEIMAEKDLILVLEDYWNLLSSEEKKAVLDHELGHIASGHLKAIEEKIKSGNLPTQAVVIEADEKEADAYSANLNGKKAMHAGLMKALDVIVKGYRKKGYRVKVSDVIAKDPVLRNRLKVLKEEDPNSEEE